MGILTGAENIEKAVGYVPVVTSEEAFQAFELFSINLIGRAYSCLKISQHNQFNYSEPQISAMLYKALDGIISKEELLCSVTWEYSEVTNPLLNGTQKHQAVKKFDLAVANWDVKNRVQYGVEAKVLVENDYDKRNADALVRDNISDAGMGKYINGIYKGRGV